MAKNKVLPYVIFGVPLLVGIYFVYKALTKPTDKDKKDTPPIDPTTPTPTPNSGGGTTYTPTSSLPFKKGSSGDYVKMIQRKLNITDDGKFGNITKSKVIEFQNNAKVTPKLTPDGIVGSKTWKAMFGAEFPNEFKASASNYTQSGSSLIVPKFGANEFN
jgi:peptidoglycan hydrolase-like protein with peptidoglycan-binding domain